MPSSSSVCLSSEGATFVYVVGTDEAGTEVAAAAPAMVVLHSLVLRLYLPLLIWSLVMW